MSPRDGSRTDPSLFRKVLLIRLRRIGDIILTTPAVRVLRTALPRAELVYVVEEPYRKLVEGNPDIDRVVAVPKGASRRDFLALVRSVRKRGFDAVVDFHGGPRASLLALLRGRRSRPATPSSTAASSTTSGSRGRPKEGRVHSVENHVNLVRALGIEAGDIPGLVLPGPAGRDLALDLPPGPLIALHIGAGNRFRYPPLEVESRHLSGLGSRRRTGCPPRDQAGRNGRDPVVLHIGAGTASGTGGPTIWSAWPACSASRRGAGRPRRRPGGQGGRSGDPGKGAGDAVLRRPARPGRDGGAHPAGGGLRRAGQRADAHRRGRRDAHRRLVRADPAGELRPLEARGRRPDHREGPRLPALPAADSAFPAISGAFRSSRRKR